MRAQRLHLAMHGFHHSRIPVANGNDVVIGIEILVPGFVVEENTLAMTDLYRVLIEQPVSRAEQTCSTFDERTCGAVEMSEAGGIEAIVHLAAALDHCIHENASRKLF